MMPAAAGPMVHGSAADMLAGVAGSLSSVHNPLLLWDELAAAGVPALLVPRSHGGLGGGLVDAVTLADGIAAAGRSLPFTPSAVLATLIVDAVGAGAVLTELATGDRILAVQLAAGVVGEQCAVAHPTCSSALRLQPAARHVAVTLAGSAAAEPLGWITGDALRQALDDASVVASAELLTQGRRLGSASCTSAFVADLVSAAAEAADADSPGRGRAARAARDATRRLLSQSLGPAPATVLLAGSWAR